MTEPCGSYQVIEWDRGNPAVVKWEAGQTEQ